MNNKGFTLIEIIICLVLIVSIGSITTVTIVNNTKDDKEIEIINKKIADAANVYINIEKDNNGKTYLSNIKNGGKGLFFTVKDLYEEGYIDKNIVTTLEKLEEKNSSKLKILASNSLHENDSELCQSGFIEFEFSWEDNATDEKIYLCPPNTTTVEPEYPETPETPDLSNDPFNYIRVNIAGESGFPNSLDNFNENSTIRTYKASQPIPALHENELSQVLNITILKNEENGLFERDDYYDSSKKEYYFRGNIDNNYLSLNGIQFRILSVSSDRITILKSSYINPNFSFTQTNNFNNDVVQYFKAWFDLKLSEFSSEVDKFRLLTFYDVVYAGMGGEANKKNVTFDKAIKCEYTTYGTNSPGKFLPSHLDLYISDSFLSDIGTTILNEYYDYYDWIYILSNDWNSGYGYAKGTILYKTMTKEYLNKNGISNLKTNMLPVIELKTSNLKISGKGTSQSPYTLKHSN